MPDQTTSPNPAAGVTATWNYTLGSIVFLFVVIDLCVVGDALARLGASDSGPERGILFVFVVTSLAASATRIRFCWFMRDAAEEHAPPLGWTIALAVPAVASWGIAFALPEITMFAAVQLWFSGAVYTCFMRRPARWAALIGLLALTLVPILLHDRAGSPGFSPAEGVQRWLVISYGAMLPFMLYMSLWIWQIVRRLDASRRLAAELAVAQERLRFASDLHDIQGHHLQVIALKAELAERTLDAAPEQAAQQVGEIRVIAKEAMEETRALVAGLREVGLGEELENAGEVLTLAGAECALRVRGIPEGREAQRALAFVVREATTNILRHSDARTAEIELAPARGGFALTVTNDGVAGAGSAGGAGGTDGAGGTGGTSGTGLAGLRERLGAIGGTLEAGVGAASRAGTGAERAAGQQFVLTVWVPGSAQATADLTSVAQGRGVQ